MTALLATVKQDSCGVSVVSACRALGLSRAGFYRTQAAQAGTPAQRAPSAPQVCRVPDRALTIEERQAVIDVLHCERFQDQAIPQVYATLLDEGVYLCSVSTMYRLLGGLDEVHERRRQRVHKPATRPELLASGPNQVWSWDITKLKGAVKWSYYYLYVILDIFSRYVVGWCIAAGESAALAHELIEESMRRQNIAAGQLTLHADRGSAMTSNSVAALLVDLGVQKSHSRPHTSDDNPYSESHFKTIKSRPQVPERFGCLEDARAILGALLVWYNHEHHHSGIAMLTPASVHHGLAPQVIAARADVLTDAFQAHPRRFVKAAPAPEALPLEVWINPPMLSEASRDACQAADPANKPSVTQAEASRDASGGSHAPAA